MPESHRRRVHLDDLELMLQAGESPFEIARRLGVKPKSISGVIGKRVRAGEYDPSARKIAAIFERAGRFDGPPRYCSCGVEIARDNPTGNCVKCANAIKLADPKVRANLAEAAARSAARRERDKEGRWVS